MKRTKIRIRFVKEDLWIGVFWKSEWDHRSMWTGDRPQPLKIKDRFGRSLLKIHICLIPCFPIVIERR